ncbi:MAG: phosphoribosyl-AMP cyclohydrolase [bacterium]
MEQINLEQLKFNEQGLIPAIIQDYKTNEILMMAYMNKESFEKTLSSGKTCFFSRSRQKLWLKGETSGNFQLVKEIYLDCDNDTLLIKVNQINVACHTGNRSCFFKKIKENVSE